MGAGADSSLALPIESLGAGWNELNEDQGCSDQNQNVKFRTIYYHTKLNEMGP